MPVGGASEQIGTLVENRIFYFLMENSADWERLLVEVEMVAFQGFYFIDQNGVRTVDTAETIGGKQAGKPTQVGVGN